MGTLFEQPPRWKRALDYTEEILINVKRLEQEFNLKQETVIKAIELSIKINDHDVKDEQLAGFGQLFEEANNIAEQTREQEYEDFID